MAVMTSIQQAPDIKSYSLAEFFVSTYQVPRYQRNFTWGEAEIAQLFDDLYEFSISSEPHYLLGDVIAGATGNTQHKYELVDGQQRSSSLMCLFAVLYITLKNHGLGQDDTNQLFNALKASRDQLKVQMSGGASKIVLDYLANPNLQELNSETRSQENVIVAFETITKKVVDTFDGQDVEAVLKFVNRLLSDTYVGRLTLQDVEHATEFFERVNNRGVRLTSADLLKNRLLQKIQDETKYLNASDVWSNAEKTLMTLGNQGTMEFLIRQIRQADLKAKVQEKDLFNKTKELVSTEEGCLELVDRIEIKFPALSEILQGRTPSKNVDIAAEGTSFFGFTQNHGVKLAGSRLSAAGFEHLSKRLEARAILSLFANERSQSYEKLVPEMASAIQNLANQNSVATSEEIDAALNFDKQKMQLLFQQAFPNFWSLSYDGTPGVKKRIRYVLARINYELNKMGAHENISLKDFLTTSKTEGESVIPGFDIDHIESQLIGSANEFNHSLGNLTLLHSADNQSAGGGEPLSKQVVYGHSKCHLTKSLTRNFPQTPQIEQIVSGLRVAVIDDEEPWGIEKMQLRHKLYFDLFFGYLAADLSVQVPDAAGELS